MAINTDVRENRRGNQKWTIKTHWQHWMIPVILKWVPYTELGFFFSKLGNFVINHFFKNQNTIFQTLSTAKVAVSVDLLKIIRWIKLYQSP